MLKKNEVIETLENGGYIYTQGHPQRAYVYSVSDGLLGSCRHDMAQRLAELDKYEAIPDGDGGNWYRICDPYAVAAEKAAAAHELSHIRTPGSIEIKAKNDCRIGGNYVAKGRCYRITVYGDGTQSTPRNAYGSLYDFNTREHAIYFEIIERPAEEQQPQGDDLDAQSARVYAATLRDFERAGVIADLEIEPLTDAAAEEAPAAPPAPKQYARADGDGATTSATVAMRWHRAGYDIIVAAPGKSAVYVHGAPQEAKRSSEDKNRDHCEHIARELDAYVNGEVKRCPDCGEVYRRDWGDVGDAFKCPNCGEVASADDWEEPGIYDFLEDVYDIEFRIGSDMELRSVQIMVACGGPNIYIDTASKDVELYWWGERARYPMSCEAVAAVDDWAEELYQCR